METTSKPSDLISLSALARRLRVSQAWLRNEADARRIPALKAGKARYLFSLAVVEKVLLERAAQGATQ